MDSNNNFTTASPEVDHHGNFSSNSSDTKTASHCDSAGVLHPCVSQVFYLVCTVPIVPTVLVGLTLNMLSFRAVSRWVSHTGQV